MQCSFLGEQKAPAQHITRWQEMPLLVAGLLIKCSAHTPPFAAAMDAKCRLCLFTLPLSQS